MNTMERYMMNPETEEQPMMVATDSLVHFTDGATTAFDEAADDGITAAEVVRTAYMCLSEAC